MTAPIDLAAWPDRLEAAIAAGGGALTGVRVVNETASTQDAARRLGARPGEIVVAWRQTAGRGRHGRAWADTGAEGIALTAVVPADPSPRLAIVGAVAAARAAETCLGTAVGIKWPNDVMVGDRKLAGVLVEQSGESALVGIGMNVNQLDWSPELAGRAISLREASGGGHACIERLEVAEALIAAFAAAIDLDDEALGAAFVRRDWLANRPMRFLVRGPEGDRTIRGRVVSLDPFRGMEVAPDGGQAAAIWLDAAVTRVLPDHGG